MKVEFADGQSAATIVLNVKDDGIPEVDEISSLTLTQILDDQGQSDNGAKLGRL